MSTHFYTVGGIVQAGSGLYIQRQADKQLFELCQAAAFAYVLTARQLGKSSLMVQTAERLQAIGTRCVLLDLTLLGTQMTADEWYLGLLRIIAVALALKTNVKLWWQEHDFMGPAQRLSTFLQEVVVIEITTPIVIFLDEIDTTLNLSFTDDFFAVIRALYNARSHQPALQGLTFVLIGVATPSDLISEPHRTPFNIGERVELTDFTLEEAAPLAKGFACTPHEAQKLLSWILEWTGGHPYLTQRLCVALIQKPHKRYTKTIVAQIVAETFFGNMSRQDSNLQFVRDMLTERVPKQLGREEILSTYRTIWLKKQPVHDNAQSLVKSHLKLSGVVYERQNILRIRNRIYETVFNEHWISEQWPSNWWEVIPTRVKVGAISMMVLILLFFLSITFVFYQQKQQAEKAMREAKAEEALSELSEHQLDQALLLALASHPPQEEPYSLLISQAVRDTLEETAVIRQPLRGHTDTINTVAWHPNGHQVLSSSQEDGSTRVWEATTGEVAYILEDQAESAAWHPHLPQILTVGALGIRIWDATTLQLLMNVGQGLEWGAWNSSGLQILTKNQVGKLQLWDATTGALVLTFDSPPVTAVNWEPNGRELLTGDHLGMIHRWDAATGKLIKSQEAHHQDVTVIAFSQGEQYLTSSRDGTLILWSQDQIIQRLKDLPTEVLAAAFSPTKNEIAIGNQDGSIQIWSLATQQLTTLGWHSAAITSIAWSPDGQEILSACQDGTMQIWQLSQLRMSLNFAPSPVSRVTFSPSERDILIVTDKKAYLWSKEALLPLTHSDNITQTVFSPEGDALMTSSLDGTVRRWTLATRQSTIIIKHPSPILALAWSQDRKRLLTGHANGVANLWDATSGQLLHPLDKHNGPVNSVAFGGNNQQLLTKDSQKIYLWSKQGLPLIQLETQASNQAIAFSPNGQQLLIGNKDNKIQIWDTSTGKLIKTLAELSSSISAVGWSPNGKYLVTACLDGSLFIWNAATSSPLYRTILSPIHTLAFSPNGEQLLTGSSDGTVQLRNWIADQSQILAQLTKRVCLVWAYNEEAIRTEIPSWQGCQKQLEAVK